MKYQAKGPGKAKGKGEGRENTLPEGVGRDQNKSVFSLVSRKSKPCVCAGY